MGYSTQKLTNESLDATRAAWALTVGDDVFISEFGALFEWIESHMNYDSPPETGSLAYAIVDDGFNTASAFIEVVGSNTRGGLTKLLKVFVTPQYWNIAEHQNEVVNIFIAAIQGAVAISSDNCSKTIKIYGRTDSLLSLLHTIHVSIMSNEKVNQAVTASVKGRWLEICSK